MTRYDNAFLEPFIQASRLDHQREMEANQQRRLEQGDRRLADNETMQAERIKQIRAQIARIQQLTNNMANNGGRSPFNQLAQDRFTQQQKNSGEAYVLPTSSGKRGLFVKPKPAEQTKAQDVIRAYPQLESALQNILKGVQYTGTNFKGDYNKIIDAASAYMMNEATPKQIEVLSKSGIALDSITKAAETASLVMNQGKTNEVMHKNIELFAPRKGDTPEVYANRVQANLGDFKERYLQSQYYFNKGMPIIALGRDDADEDAAQEDLDNFIDANWGKSFGFGGSKMVKKPRKSELSNEEAVTPTDEDGLMEVIDVNHPEIIKAAQKLGITPEEMYKRWAK